MTHDVDDIATRFLKSGTLDWAEWESYSDVVQDKIINKLCEMNKILGLIRDGDIVPTPNGIMDREAFLRSLEEGAEQRVKDLHEAQKKS
jgi:hypothetical protein